MTDKDIEERAADIANLIKDYATAFQYMYGWTDEERQSFVYHLNNQTSKFVDGVEDMRGQDG